MESMVTLSGITIAPGRYLEPPTLLPSGNRDENGFAQCARACYTVQRSPHKEVFHYWYEPDVLVMSESSRPMPHNHPFGLMDGKGGISFTSTVLKGWIKEERFWVHDGVLCTETIIHEEGSSYEMPVGVFHYISEISEGGAVTHMVAKPSDTTNWGYLDTDTLEIVPPITSEEYGKLLAELNPHLRQGWKK